MVGCGHVYNHRVGKLNGRKCLRMESDHCSVNCIKWDKHRGDIIASEERNDIICLVRTPTMIQPLYH